MLRREVGCQRHVYLLIYTVLAVFNNSLAKSKKVEKYRKDIFQLFSYL